jgi:exodeoxyribonuclease V gamma subunit
VTGVLHLHRSSRGDLLVRRLAEELADAPQDPFAAEVIAVPTRGVERWLTQQLSNVLGASPGREDGVCANVDFPFPAALVGDALAAVTGIARDADPWLPDRLVWPLLDVVDGCLDEGWLTGLSGHLGGGPGEPDEALRSRRWSTVRHLADLYDRYGVHRPALVQAWAAGDDVDASGRPLPIDLAWQAELWRRVRTHLGVPSPAERLPEACAELRARPDLLGLPGRISIFGLTRLSVSYLDVLVALSSRRQVHLWLLHPSEVRWQAAVGPPDPLGPRPRHAGGDRSGHPLLAAWGRDAAEMQRVLAAGVLAAGVVAAEEAVPGPAHPATLLGRLQAAIRADVVPEAPPTVPLDVGDRSLQVHACHGRARQVEVLREVVLGLLEDDETLEPRDIIVMCPDIDTFAPLIGATFGPGQEVAGRDLHVRLADRSLRQTNPLLTALSQLLDLADGRLTASAVVDFAGSAPVRRRFGFDDDDLSRIEEWVRSAGIRWGIDGEGRRPWKLASLAAGTWSSGLDRLLLGVAMSEDDLRCFGGVLPLDDLGSGDIERVGRLAELVDRLALAVEDLRGRRDLDDWLALLAGTALDLTATSPADAWQAAELQAVLMEVADDARTGGSPAQGGTVGGGTADDARTGGGTAQGLLSLTELRALLTQRLRGRPTRANFRTGHLTMCTLVPMRSVPHRVVCLLGLDDGVFPRHPGIDGDDLLERDPWVGDRDARTEDRQLLLDAVLAAGDRLVITYAGRNERTNAVRPPAVPVGELLDAVEATVTSPDDRPVRQHVVIEHPLQSWDERNFLPGALVPDRLWSFDRVALDGARAAAGPRVDRPGLAGVVLPPDHRDPVELEDLVRFIQHPVKSFLQHRLGLRLPDEGQDPADGLAVELGGLDRWAVGDRLLTARLGGADRGACQAAEVARGDLPPLALGRQLLEPLLDQVDALVEAAGGTGRPRAVVDVLVELPGHTVMGTVPDLVGDELSTVTFSNLAAKHRLAAWVRLVALTAADPERPWRARSVGRGSRGAVAIRELAPLGVEAATRAAIARRHLAALVDLYDRGRSEPLPLYCRTSEAWAVARLKGRDPVGAARRAWMTEPGASYPGEDDDLAHQLLFGGPAPFAELLLSELRAGEEGQGWVGEEPTRLGRLARRLWDPVLAVEVAG